MGRLRALLAAAALTVAMAAESSSAAGPPQPGNDAGARTVAAGDNALGFALLRALTTAASSNNVVVSPMSIGLALSMASNGAAGSTLAQMQQALGTSGMSTAAVNDAHHGLVAQLRAADPAVAFEVGNSLWARAGVAFSAPFIERVRTGYDADAQTLDFASPVAPARINGLVDKQTHGLVTDLIDRIDPATVLIIVNTLYFKGKWSQAFDARATHAVDFTTAAGATVKVPMMSRNGDFAYAQTGEYEAVALPYGAGRLRMLVVLPTRGGKAQTLASKLTPEAWSSLRSSLRKPAYGSVALPRFSTKVRYELARQLRDAGMHDAFDPQRADFSGMVDGGAVAGERVYIGEVRHVAVVKVDEEGTEASAATSVGMRATAVRMPSFTIVVDRPFVFTIEDDATGALLFLGVINDPR